MSNNIYFFNLIKWQNLRAKMEYHRIETLNVFISLLGICISKDIYFSNKDNVNQKLQDDSLEQTQYYYLTDSGYIGEVQ